MRALGEGGRGGVGSDMANPMPTVTANGQTLLSQPSFTHSSKARWHKVLWSGGAAPNVRVRHNMRYFLDSGATWNYNLGLTIPETVLAAEASNLAKVNTGPMGTAMLTTNMPGTGGRAEIGREYPFCVFLADFPAGNKRGANISQGQGTSGRRGWPLHRSGVACVSHRGSVPGLQGVFPSATGRFTFR